MLSIVQDPQKLWAHIEITPECGPVKYEFDARFGLVVDRFLRTPMHYPLPYGYIANTLAEDGDALDILVMVPSAIMPTSWIQVRPVAVLVMEDEKGMDQKILAVPINAVSHLYDNIQNISDVPQDLLDRITDFFLYYKTRDSDKWSKVHDFLDVEHAYAIIAETIARYNSVN